MPKKTTAAGPLVSVIIPAYNTESTISESIDSVLNQTYKNFEIIVVDDGSPDGVANLVTKKYGSKVRLIQQPNKGLASARNTGIKSSEGEFVAFLDSDDMWLPKKLELQVEQAAHDKKDTVFYTNCFFWEQGKKKALWTDIHRQASGLIASELINREVMVPVLTSMVRKDAIASVGGFDESLRQVEDYDLWLRMSVAGHRFKSIPEPLALYRVNPEGLSSNLLQMAKTQLFVYKKILKTSPPELSPLIAHQIKIYNLEVLHQHRRELLKEGRISASAITTLKMIPYSPKKFFQLIATSVLLALGSSNMISKLSR